MLRCRTCSPVAIEGRPPCQPTRRPRNERGEAVAHLPLGRLLRGAEERRLLRRAGDAGGWPARCRLLDRAAGPAHANLGNGSVQRPHPARLARDRVGPRRQRQHTPDRAGLPRRLQRPGAARRARLLRRRRPAAASGRRPPARTAAGRARRRRQAPGAGRDPDRRDHPASGGGTTARSADGRALAYRPVAAVAYWRARGGGTG